MEITEGKRRLYAGNGSDKRIEYILENKILRETSIGIF